MHRWNRLLLALGILTFAPLAHAQTFNSGSTGANGALSPTSNVTLTLPANGVFNFTAITIPTGVTVKFTRNAANTPVTLLASGNVTIAGIIDVSGANGGAGSGSTVLLGPNAGGGGPGGFDGGNGANGIVGTVGGRGLGPGGGNGGGGWGGGGGYLTAGVAGAVGGGSGGSAYGNAALLPLIGGSAGGGGGGTLTSTGAGGGGGGGAIVIASSGTITFTGSIRAKGGSGGTPGAAAGGGSGGAVRLVATVIIGSGGSIDVSGGTGDTSGYGGGVGSLGRKRIEAFSNTAGLAYTPPTPSLGTPSAVALTNAPLLRISSVGGVTAPSTPTSSLASPDITLPATTTNPVAVLIAGANIPPGATVQVTVAGRVGSSTSNTATLAGTQSASSATVNVTIPTNQPSIVSASATFTLSASNGQGPVYVEGEAIERVRVTALYGGSSRVSYITRSGREIVPGQ